MAAKVKARQQQPAKKRPQRATSNIFAMFDQSQIQEYKEAFNLFDQDRVWLQKNSHFLFDDSFRSRMVLSLVAIYEICLLL